MLQAGSPKPLTRALGLGLFLESVAMLDGRWKVMEGFAGLLYGSSRIALRSGGLFRRFGIWLTTVQHRKVIPHRCIDVSLPEQQGALKHKRRRIFVQRQL